MASKEALEAATEAAKKRWWNTTPVREAAERAVEQITARIASGRRRARSDRAPPEGGASMTQRGGERVGL